MPTIPSTIPAPDPTTPAAPNPLGRLSSVLAIREEQADPEAPIVIHHREALIYALGKAAELEHLVVCQYLYAGFSLRRGESEGLTTEQVETVKRWRRTLNQIAGQEMLHLAIVQNLLTAVGAGPHLARPNFPLPPRSYPAGVQMALLPFGETALRHFAYLERPEGMAMSDVEGFAALEKAIPLPRPPEDEVGPVPMDFETIGHLYRSIEKGLAELAGRLGEDGLFIGPPEAQATPDHFRWPELVAVRDLATAGQAIATIVEQGEGARGDWREAHFGRLLEVLDEFLAVREADPAFDPVRPVLAANVRLPESGVHMPIITDHFTARCVDLLNATYEVVLQLLSRYFAHSGESEAQLETLADVAVELMYGAVSQLGALVTRLPIGPAYPGQTAGPTLELFYAVDYLLPHKDAAWTLMQERLREVADLGVRCKEACVPLYMAPLVKITEALEKQADRLAAAANA